MDEMIKQELWRSVGVFWVAIGLSFLILKQLNILNGRVLIGLALMITLFISSSFIIIRKNIHRGKEVVSLIVGILLIILGALTAIFWKLFIGNIIIILIGMLVLIYGLIQLSKNKD